MEKILVIGANGATGKHIVKILSNIDRYHIKALIRSEEQKENFDCKAIEFYVGDLEKDFSKAFEEVDKVIFAAGSGGSTSDKKTIAVDQNGAKKAIDYAVEYQLKKFVMLSSMGTEHSDKVKGLEVYLKAKKEANDYLKNQRIDYSILQPGTLTKYEAKHKIKKIKGVANGSVSREDVAYILVKCLNQKICNNKSFSFINGTEPVDEVLSEI